GFILNIACLRLHIETEETIGARSSSVWCTQPLCAGYTVSFVLSSPENLSGLSQITVWFRSIPPLATVGSAKPPVTVCQIPNTQTSNNRFSYSSFTGPAFCQNPASRVPSVRPDYLG
ncbi:hypothetical protein T310_8051, partial [Rasamsonia emersonii CBS 393.64]